MLFRPRSLRRLRGTPTWTVRLINPIWWLFFQAGKYESNSAATWAEGDWNGDGLFDTADFVLALNEGCYGQPAPTENPDPVDVNPTASTPIVLSPQGIFDPTMGLVASTFLVPNGWVFNSGVSYGPVPSMVRSGFLYAATADGTLGVEEYDAEANLTWTEGPLGALEIGQPDFRGLIASPPRDGIEYFGQTVLPNLRQQHPDYEVLDIRREPGLIAAQVESAAIFTQLLGTVGGQIQFDAISVLARYRVNGQWVDESLTAQFSYTTVKTGQFRSTDWGMTRMERTFAPQGALPANEPLLRMIGRSAVVNPAWWKTQNSFRLQLHGIVADSQQDFDRYIQSQNALSQQRDQIFDQFNQYIRGTEVVNDPFTGHVHEVVSDGEVWFGSHGEVIVGVDPTFNPNEHFGGNWLQA